MCTTCFVRRFCSCFTSWAERCCFFHCSAMFKRLLQIKDYRWSDNVFFLWNSRCNNNNSAMVLAHGFIINLSACYLEWKKGKERQQFHFSFWFQHALIVFRWGKNTQQSDVFNYTDSFYRQSLFVGHFKKQNEKNIE